jgi:hypothetical protein
VIKIAKCCDWFEFEKKVVEISKEVSIDLEIESEHPTKNKEYKSLDESGETGKKRPDIIIYNRSTGKSAIIDAKCYKKSYLGKDQVDKIISDQRHTRSNPSSSILVVNGGCKISDKVTKYAEDKKVTIIFDNRNLSSNLKKAILDLSIMKINIHGYERNDGTFVKSHERSLPSTSNDNNDNSIQSNSSPNKVIVS